MATASTGLPVRPAWLAADLRRRAQHWCCAVCRDQDLQSHEVAFTPVRGRYAVQQCSQTR
jgi:hypothetical protein